MDNFNTAILQESQLQCCSVIQDIPTGIIDAMNEDADLRHKLHEAIRRAIENHFGSAQRWAEAAKVSPTTITRFLKNPETASVPTMRTIGKLEAAYGKALLNATSGRAESDIAGEPEIKVASEQPLPRNLDIEDLPRDVPVLGTAKGGHKGSFILNQGEAIDFVRRPPGIMKARDVYAIYVEGDSMIDRFLPGELVYAHPGRKVKIGDFVIVQIKGKNGQAEAYIKKLVRRSASKVVFQQSNPKRTITWPEKDIISIHLILTMNDLHGV